MIGLCKEPLLVPIHSFQGVGNCIVVFVILMFEAYE